MKPGAKIFLGYAAIAVAAAAMSFGAIATTRSAMQSATMVTQHTVPSLEALSDLRHGGLRVVSSVMEFVVLRAQADNGRVAPAVEQEAEEQNLIAEGCEVLERACDRYAALVESHNPDELQLVRLIRTRAGGLREAGWAVADLVDAGAAGQDVLDAKEDFERSERKFLLAVDRARRSETEEAKACSSALTSAGRQALFAVLLAGGVTILLALALGAGIGRPLAASLRRLTQGSRAIGAGNLATRIVVTSRDETAELATAFNDMAARLQQTSAEMHAARQAAEAASRAKSDFLAHMSHEIRTPLNGILGLTQFTLETELSPEQRQHLDLVMFSGEMLLRVINDVLDFSKIEAGRLDLQQVAFDPRVSVERALGTLRPLALQKGLALATRIDAQLPSSLMGDPGRFEQVLYNLVGNALKFTEQGGVTVEIDAADAAAVAGPSPATVLTCRVEDTGCGIPAAQQASIFNSFVQVDGSLTRRQDGTGLGLTISRRLVEMMGGEIGVTSQVGRGSTFHFTVRLVRPADDPVARPVPAPPGEPSATTPGATRALHLLVAEDNAVNQLLVRRLLERLGHTVHLVGDGKAALVAWSAGRYDAVLMDIQMPEMDGYEATHRIRTAEAARQGRTPIIAVTAHALESERTRADKAGMDGYLTKPITPRALAAALAAVTTDDRGIGVGAPPA